MSLRDDSPLAPRVFTFADAFTAKGEQRRRILEAIVKQNEQRGAQLQAVARVTMQATPTPIKTPSARKVSTAR
jgi:hypothetical protein